MLADNDYGVFAALYFYAWSLVQSSDFHNAQTDSELISAM